MFQKLLQKRDWNYKKEPIRNIGDEDTMEEIKQNMDSLNVKSGGDIIEEQIRIIEDRHVEMLQIVEERELRLKGNEESLRNIQLN